MNLSGPAGRRHARHSRMLPCRPYPSAIADAEWAFIAPSMALPAPDALQRKHKLHGVLNAPRAVAHGGSLARVCGRGRVYVSGGTCATPSCWTNQRLSALAQYSMSLPSSTRRVSVP